MSAPTLHVLPVPGLPELRPGDDLAALVAAAVDLHDGDVVVVTSKAVSKVEGRLVPVPLLMTDLDATAAMARAALDLAGA